MDQCELSLPINKTATFYKKEPYQPGPASLFTALLLDKGLFTAVFHRQIKPAIPLPTVSSAPIAAVALMSNNNYNIMTHSTDDTDGNHTTTENDYLDALLYIIETLPFHYLTIKSCFNDRYIYLNHHFRDLTEQLNEAIIAKQTAEIFTCDNIEEHPSVRNIRYLDRRAYLSRSIRWLEESVLDSKGENYRFYTWKVPLFHVVEENVPTRIVTVSLPFRQLPFHQGGIAF